MVTNSALHACRFRAYTFALGTVAAATALRWVMDPALGEHHPFTLYFAAVAVAAWYGGFAPALFATTLSYFAADWFFITPRFEINLPHANPDEFLALIGFLFSCLAIAFTSHRMRGALYTARKKQAELQSEIAERERAQDALAQAQAALRRHAADLEQKVHQRTLNLRETILSLEGVCYHLAHDLRAPLRAMHGYTTVLQNQFGATLDENGLRYLDRIHDASARMDLLIHGLLDYGRLGHERFPLGPTDAETVLARILDRFSSEISTAGAQIERSPLPMLEANERLLELVLSQLISNALKFIPPRTPPRIRIFSEGVPQPGLVRILVQDHGVGISQEYLSRVFWIFERLHVSQGYAGTGIGLALASKAVERMHGAIGVQSIPGQGSTFWFDLPLASKPEIEIPTPTLEHATAA